MQFFTSKGPDRSRFFDADGVAIAHSRPFKRIVNEVV